MSTTTTNLYKEAQCVQYSERRRLSTQRTIQIVVAAESGTETSAEARGRSLGKRAAYPHTSPGSAQSHRILKQRCRTNPRIPCSEQLRNPSMRCSNAVRKRSRSFTAAAKALCSNFNCFAARPKSGMRWSAVLLQSTGGTSGNVLRRTCLARDGSQQSRAAAFLGSR